MVDKITGMKKLTNIGNSLILIIDKAFLTSTSFKSGDIIKFTIEKISDDKHI